MAIDIGDEVDSQNGKYYLILFLDKADDHRGTN